jgi:hypothetical protein
MDRKEYEDAAHEKLKWIANVDKDDEGIRRKGYIIGPPKTEDQFSSEEFEEKGVVGLHIRLKKEARKGPRD